MAALILERRSVRP